MPAAFSIVTPSYNMLDLLLRCAASVSDQSIPTQHLIQDARTEGFEEANKVIQSLGKRFPIYSPEPVSEPDDGMYHAINRGFKRARHQLLAYLNCDEQYLPGALEMVAQYFSDHPEVDMVFGDVLILSEHSVPLSYRKAILPRAGVIRTSHLPTLTCATFFRSHLLDRFPFRTDLKAIADAYWILEMLKAGVPMGVLGEATSVFYYTDSNLSDSSTARREAEDLRRTGGFIERAASPVIKLSHRLEKAVHGCYRPPTGTYPVYTGTSPQRSLINTSRLSGILKREA